jgi:hypothetical protein
VEGQPFQRDLAWGRWFQIPSLTPTSEFESHLFGAHFSLV